MVDDPTTTEREWGWVYAWTWMVHSTGNTTRHPKPRWSLPRPPSSSNLCWALNGIILLHALEIELSPTVWNGSKHPFERLIEFLAKSKYILVDRRCRVVLAGNSEWALQSVIRGPRVLKYRCA